MELNDAQKQLKTHKNCYQRTRVFFVLKLLKTHKNLLQMEKRKRALVTENVLFHIIFPQIFFCAHNHLNKVNSAHKFVRFYLIFTAFSEKQTKSEMSKRLFGQRRLVLPTSMFVNVPSVEATTKAVACGINMIWNSFALKSYQIFLILEAQRTDCAVVYQRRQSVCMFKAMRRIR